MTSDNVTKPQIPEAEETLPEPGDAARAAKPDLAEKTSDEDGKDAPALALDEDLPAPRSGAEAQATPSLRRHLPNGSEDASLRAPSLDEQERMVEAILFASAQPVTVAEMNARMPPGSDAAEAVRLLERHYQGRGVSLRRVGDAWAFRTAPDLGFLLRREVVETRKLSRAAIETLAIIAYHQPVTRAEIEEIRGVAVSRGTLDQLLDLDWIRFGRRKMTPGRPVTFVVTEEFLDHFGLVNARDLPGLKELRAAGLLDSRGLPGGEASPEDPDEAAQPDPAQGDMFHE